jgi:transcriptional regulator with XRE-family HTH domain
MERIQMVDRVSVLQLRGRILGALLRDARLKAGKSIPETAALIGISPDLFEKYELGGQSISLPELELLAKNLHFPIETLLERQPSDTAAEIRPRIEPAAVIKLRQRIIGATLRQKRLEHQITSEELAGQVGIEKTELDAYELGIKSLPVPLLEAICAKLSCKLSDFLEQSKPVKIVEKSSDENMGVLDLPDEIRSFVGRPINRPYIELAIKLSEMSVERLRAIAEGLLEITY